MSPPSGFPKENILTQSLCSMPVTPGSSGEKFFMPETCLSGEIMGGDVSMDILWVYGLMLFDGNP